MRAREILDDCLGGSIGSYSDQEGFEAKIVTISRVTFPSLQAF